MNVLEMRTVGGVAEGSVFCLREQLYPGGKFGWQIQYKRLKEKFNLIKLAQGPFLHSIDFYFIIYYSIHFNNPVPVQDDPDLLLSAGLLRALLFQGVPGEGEADQPGRLPDHPAHRRLHPRLEKPGHQPGGRDGAQVYRILSFLGI